MSAYRHEREQTVVVAQAPSAADAELIRITLAAHGLEAVVSASFPAYPSVDFVQGVQVLVRPADEEAARDLLRTLGLSEDDPG